MIIGILGLQGDVAEHITYLCLQGIVARVIKKPHELEGIEGLIIPGGESTTISKLLVSSGLLQPIKALIDEGLPVWGTCAGVILLSQEGLLESAPVKATRNAYGAQIHSFIGHGKIAGKITPMVFIRAPKIEWLSPDVEVLSTLDGNIVAARHKNILLTAFHPELTKDCTILDIFLEMIAAQKSKSKSSQIQNTRLQANAL
jgi:5'-phosphate synthase pdxT subunit